MQSIIPAVIGIYARYSSDLQNPSSVDDQVALCRNFISDQFGQDPRVLIFKDAAISGATMERPGMLRLLAAAKEQRVNLVVAESLDRLSRSLKDIAAVYETFGFHGVAIWTAHEGRINELHVGLRGTMNALYLKDMKAKVRRGQIARVAAGYASSSCPYGYRVVRGVVDEKGRNVNGIREINEEQAVVVRRIFREYVDGRSIPDIVKGLNRDGVPSATGKLWRRTSVAGSPKKCEGVLLNEAYIGNLVYNRTRVVRDPISNKKRFFPVPEEEWTRAYVPKLQIIDDETWEKAQALHRRRRVQRATRAKEGEERRPRILDTHNQHALTGWVKCSQCGGKKTLANDTRYVCATHRYARKCPNARGTKERVLMEATFRALRDRIKDGQGFRDRFLQAFAREMQINERLQTEAEEIKARINRLMAIVERGFDIEHVSDRLLQLQDKLDLVQTKIRAEAPPTLPSEETIRSTLLRMVNEIELSGDIERQRMLFRHVLKEIILTPILGQRAGETFNITLREAGWPELWETIAKNG